MVAVMDVWGWNEHQREKAKKYLIAGWSSVKKLNNISWDNFVVRSLDSAVFLSKAFVLQLPNTEFHLLLVVCHVDQQTEPNIQENTTSIFFPKPVKC